MCKRIIIRRRTRRSVAVAQEGQKKPTEMHPGTKCNLFLALIYLLSFFFFCTPETLSGFTLVYMLHAIVLMVAYVSVCVCVCVYVCVCVCVCYCMCAFLFFLVFLFVSTLSSSCVIHSSSCRGLQTLTG